jgi:outer membrane protein
MGIMLRFVSLIAVLAFAPAAWAQSKIGFIDVQRAVREIEEGKAAFAELKKDLEQKQKQFDVKRAELEKLKADFDKQQVVMSEAVKKEKAAALEKRAMELQQLWVSLQKDLSDRERDALRPVEDKLNTIVREVAEADGFSMIIASSPVLVYAAQSLDVTNEVIRKYNARFPAKKAAGAPKPAAAAKK